MKPIQTLTAALAVLAGTSGCQSWPPGAPSAERVSEGMNDVQVIAALGAPAIIYSTATSERWAYCLPGALFDEYVAVDFQNGAVAMTSGALEMEYGACEMALEPGFDGDGG